jgi:hypothetical protein
MINSVDYFPIKKYRGWPAADYGMAQLDSITLGGVTYQVTSYMTFIGTGNVLASACYVVVGWRTLPAGTWTWYTYNGSSSTFPAIYPHAIDAHQYIEIQIDNDGYVHFAGWAHDYVQQYRRSDSPLGTWAGGVTANLPIGTTNNVDDTYPTFFKDPQGELYILRRCYGISGMDDWDLHSYNRSTQLWSYFPGTDSQGRFWHGYLVPDSIGNYWGMYWYDPKFTSDWNVAAGTGYLKIAFTTRTASNNYMDSIYYARCDTSGNWTQWDGAAQTMPINKTNARLMYANSFLTAQVGSSLDANNNLHIAVKMSDTGDSTGILQLYDVYFDATGIHLHQLTSNPSGVNVTEGPYGYAPYPTPSGHTSFFDKSTNVAYVFEWLRTGVTGTGLSLFASAPNDFTSWTQTIFYTADLDWTTIGFDFHQWDTNKIIYLTTCMGKALVAANPSAIEYMRLITATIDAAAPATRRSFGMVF